MPSRVRSRTLPITNKPSIRARQAALNASRIPGRSSQTTVDHIAPEADVRPFLRQVRQTLDGNLLHYSDRLRLIREAQRMGIARFEANLLIATIQHRAMQEAPPSSPTHASPRIAPRVARIILLTSAMLTAEFFLLGFVIHALAGT